LSLGWGVTKSEREKLTWCYRAKKKCENELLDCNQVKERPLINNKDSFHGRRRTGMFKTIKESTGVNSFIPEPEENFLILFPEPKETQESQKIHKSLNQKQNITIQLLLWCSRGTSFCFSSHHKQNMCALLVLETIMAVMSSCCNEDRFYAVLETRDNLRHKREWNARKTTFIRFLPFLILSPSLIVSHRFITHSQSQNQYINTCEHNRFTNQDKKNSGTKS
jgi:hypothetical protein